MVPRMDMVRCSGMGKVPDVRFRPAFEDWSARFIVIFSQQLPVETIVDLISKAGKIGIGEWRPEKDGSFGTFEISRAISDPKELKEVRELCRTPLKKLVIPEWAMHLEITPEMLNKLKNE